MLFQRRGEVATESKECIAQDAGGHRPGAPDAVAQPAEHPATDRGAQKKGGLEPSEPASDDRLVDVEAKHTPDELAMDEDVEGNRLPGEAPGEESSDEHAPPLTGGQPARTHDWSGDGVR